MTRHDDERRYEQERGKPLPGVRHAFTQARLIGAAAQAGDRHTAFSELDLDLNGCYLTPDLCFYPRMKVDLARDVLRMTEPPLLAVWIENPSEEAGRMRRRIRQMLQAGVQSCWLVQPALRTISVFAGEGRPETFTRGTLADPATGIEVNLGDVFPE